MNNSRREPISATGFGPVAAACAAGASRNAVAVAARPESWRNERRDKGGVFFDFMQTGENSVESNESQDWTRPLSQNWPDKKYKSARRWHRYEFTLHFREHVVMRTEEFAIRLFQKAARRTFPS